MRFLRHTATVLLVLFLIVGVPVYKTGYFQNAEVETVSSASEVVDMPEVDYVVLINRDRHTNAENLAVWEKFFRGEEIDYLFEDISCLVSDMDPDSLKIARSLQSRLPENQMKIGEEETTVLVSKALYGKYDVILMSPEMYSIYDMVTERAKLDNTRDDVIMPEEI